MLTRTRRGWTRRVAAMLAVLSVPAVTAHGQDPLPSGTDLVARYVNAIGGEPAWRTLTSIRAAGITELPAQNLRGTFEILSARPARSIVRMDIGGIGKAESGYTGEVGWTIDPMVGPSLVTGASLIEMKNDAHFDAVLHPKDLIASVVTVGRVEFDGRQAFKATVTYVSGQVRDEFFDVENGLLLGTEGISATPMGKVPMKMVLRDYKAFGGIRQPTRLIQSSMGFDQHFIVDTLELNTVKPEALEPPPMIRAIIRTEPVTIRARPVDVESFDAAWTIIRDSFFDPTFGGLDWEGVRASLRPKLLASATPEAARSVMREMLATLKRSHFAIMPAMATSDEPAPTGDSVVPIETRLLDDAVVITRVRAGSDAARAGLAPGQTLLEVDGVPVAQWLTGDAGDSRVKAMQVWRHVYRALQGPDRSEARLRVHDGRAERLIVVRRTRADGERVVLGDLPPFFVQVSDRRVETALGHAVGVVAFNVWMTSADQALQSAIDRHRGGRGLVIDLRGNPGGLANMIRGVAGHLFSEEVVLGRMKTRDSDLEFPANPRLVMPDGRRVNPFAGPVALLVDELTASASECFAGGLQSVGRARVFGRTTAGQALPASTRRLPNGDLLMYVVGDFVTPTGRRLEGEGVIPDEPVVLDAAALRAGKDPDLDAALRWIDQKIAG